MKLLRRPGLGQEMGEMLLAAMEGALAHLWTALPARVERFDPDRSCVDCQPLIQVVVADELGRELPYELPLLVDCPVQFPRGGGFALTFPIAPGDEGLVVFASRCIDSWWQDGRIEPPAELRAHDLSDGFYLPGVRSLPNVEGAIDASDVTLRSVDPAGPRVSLTPGGAARVYAPASVTVESGGTVDVTAATVNITGTLVINGQPYLAHTHSDPEGGSTGGVNP